MSNTVTPTLCCPLNKGTEQSKSSHSINYKASKLKLPSWATVLMCALVTMMPTVQAQTGQVSLQSTQMNVDNVFVSEQSTITLEMFKKSNSRVALWQANMCFELVIESPYQNPADYSAFLTATPPICTPVTDGVAISCGLKSGSTDTIQFYFSDVQTSVSGFASLRFNITNFQTPFSSQSFKNILLKTYSDKTCTKIDSNNQRDLTVQSVTIKPQTMPGTSVEVSSSNKVIGYRQADNSITFSFTPKSQFAPGRAGLIRLYMPYLYQIGQVNVMPYNPKAFNKCTSACFSVVSSQLFSQHIEVVYSDMLTSCLKGAKVTIKCDEFYNPIYQDLWDGYSIEIYDKEPIQRLIEKSIPTTLDATQYTPAQMPPSALQVEPSDSTVNTESQWTLNFNPNIALGNECYIRLYIPTDLEYNFQSVDTDGIFLPRNQQPILATTDFVIYLPTATEPRTSIKFFGCNQDSSLGATPFGRAMISEITTQKAVKDSGDFGLEIWKDEDMTMAIAVLQPGVKIFAISLSPGFLNNLQIYPLISTVQVSSLLYIVFETEHTLYQGAKLVIRLPSGLSLPADGSIIEVTPLAGSTRVTQATVQSGTIEILNFVQVEENIAPYKYQFALSDISNQISAKDAGDLAITTYYKASDGQYYLVDTASWSKSFTATTGLLSADKDLSIDNPTNFAANAVYTFTFSEDSMVPVGGFIKIDFPSEINFDSAAALIAGTCATTQCTLSGDKSIIIKTTTEVQKSEQVIIEIGGVKNQRSFVPSGSFTITTFDTDGVSLIDIGYKKNVATSIAGEINQFTLTRNSTVNGAVNEYTFTLTTSIPMEDGDVLKFEFPKGIQVNAGGKTTECIPKIAGDKIVCGISGNDIQITQSEIVTVNKTTFQWTMTNIGNPGSTAPSDGFTSIYFETPFKYLVSNYSSNLTAAVVTNTIPAQIVTYNLFQDSLQNSAKNNYTITFDPVNALPATGSITLVYPKQISLPDGNDTKCFVTTNRLFSGNCIINTFTRTVTITKVFETAAPYSSEITIMLQNVANPIDNRRYPNDGFYLSTYSDEAHLYIADIAQDVMVPILSCDYPCATCMEGDRLSCTGCWQSADIAFNFLMTYTDGKRGQCLTECDYNHTSNGTPDRRCTKCDESCNDCYDNGQINDTQQCVLCANSHPFRLANTNFCLNTCRQGIFERTLFQDSEFVCDTCTKPCLGCYGTKTNCTSCDQQSVLRNLWKNDCIQTCPDGSTSVAGVCTPCISPCKNCAGSPSICIDCDGTLGRSLILNSTCYDDCPLQYANNLKLNTCVGCMTGCDRCNETNTTQCQICADKLFLFNDTCRGSCPDGWRGRDRVCINGSDDLRVLYFPFLIAAFILTITVFFGKLKRKAILVDGKIQKISSQWSIVVINAVVAPLQTMATIVQFALALYYGYILHFVLALIVFIICMVFNILYLTWFTRSFVLRKPAEIGTSVTYKGREILIQTKEDSEKHPQAVDPLFSGYRDKHTFPCYLILAFTGFLHFKTSKMYYSRFYMFDMFKAQWTKATNFRTLMYKWQLIFLIAVDIMLIIIGIFGLLMIWNGVVNQLVITMVETIILSIYLIVLGIIEKCYIVPIFDYTENQQSMISSEGMKGYDKKKGRKLQMNNLLLKVKNSSSAAFKDNKLSDLLQMFGGRRCKSMTELATGWPEEEDPRHVKTWPISRDIVEQLELAGLKKFTAEDSYALQDNCYAEGVHRNKGKDKNIQGDAAKIEFQNALNRKHGDLMAKMDEQDEMHTRKATRRRGRKNKYYNQIDLEDDQEVDPDEASDKDADLQIIKEQEEEEENLRKMVAESSKKQQEVTAARTGKLDKERLTREQKAEREAGEIKLKQQQESQAVKKQQMIEALRLQQEQLQRKQLEEEAASILKHREEQELAEQAAKVAASDAARKEYEALELLRLAASEEDRKRRLAEEEALLVQDLARAKLEKEDALSKLDKERQESDARGLLENQMYQENQEQLRIQEKEVLRVENDKLRTERNASEAAEKLAKQIADEKIAADLLEAKTLKKLSEKEQKDADKAQRDADRLQAESDSKLEKEKRKAREEEDRIISKDKLAKEKEERDMARLLEQQKEADDLAARKQAEKDDAARKKAEKEDEAARKKAEKDASAQIKKEPEVAQKSKTLPPAATSVLKQETKKITESPKKVTNEDSKIPNMREDSVKNQMKSLDQSQDIDVMSAIVDLNSNVMQDFAQKKESLVTIPPNANLRTFNEHDVLGDLDRDDKGNVVVLEDKNGRKHDKKRNPVNNRGYLIDPKTNDVIENLTNQPMFAAEDLDERGEIPAPFCYEKHNFNPHQLMGDFDYQDGKPILMKTSQGFYIDKKARRVNSHGWYTNPNQGHIIDKDGRKKLDKRQLAGEDLHKLFNYNGKRFDIKDVMGQFDKDQNGNIQPQQSGKNLLDNLGRLVNDKGYLIDEQGCIIDVNGRVLWKKTDLKSGEFPKIFPFTKFNIQRVQGEIDIDEKGTPVLKKTPSGTGFVDRKGRLVNSRGYLVDKFGNIVDINGMVMFDKAVLEADGEIPQVYRTGLLRSDTASSLSRLMSEIERNNQSDNGGRGDVPNDSAYERLRGGDGDTSVDSKMEDTPANYNIPNQRFDSDGNNEAIPEDEEGGEHMAASDFSDNDDPAVLIQKKKQKPKKKKKKPKMQTIEFLEPTNRERNMAGAYGGAAKGEMRRPGIKYDKDRLNNSKKFRVSTAEEPLVRAQLAQLANNTADNFMGNTNQTGSKPEPKRQGLMKASDGLSSHSKSMRGNTTGKNRPPRNNMGSQKRGINDADFEQMFGKDIDQFLEDSEWDIESQDKVSQGSRGSRSSLVNAQKLKAMEKVYLKRMEDRPQNKTSAVNMSRGGGSGLDMNRKPTVQKKREQRGPDRETIISITDDPGVIHRGEILPFATKKTFRV